MIEAFKPNLGHFTMSSTFYSSFCSLKLKFNVNRESSRFTIQFASYRLQIAIFNPNLDNFYILQNKIN